MAVITKVLTVFWQGFKSGREAYRQDVKKIISVAKGSQQ